jgi:hypothetical protein
MMRRILLSFAVLAAFGVLGLRAGPEEGSLSLAPEVGPAVEGEPTPFEMKLTFRGGVRTRVTALGDHKPIVPLDVAVYDKNDKLVAKDESKRDFITVSWVPPRTGEYRIVIRNYGEVYNKLYIFIK